MERCVAALSGRRTTDGQSRFFDDVYEKLSAQGRAPELIIFTSDYDSFPDCTLMLHESFPETQVVGVTSSTNYSSDGLAENALSALAVYEGLECFTGVLEDVSRCPIRCRGSADRALRELKYTDADKGRVCCLEFTTAYAPGTELALDTLGEVVGERDIPAFGSSAAVRRGTQRSRVSLNGKVCNEGCVFAFIRNLNGRIALVHENTYRPANRFFTVTGTDCERHKVTEIDGRPAAAHLAALFGVQIPELARNAALHPIGRIYGERIYPAEIQSLEPDGSVRFRSYIYNYSRGVLLEPDDPGRVRERFLDGINGTGFRPGFSLAVNCAFDYDMFADKGLDELSVKTFTEKCGCFLGVSGCGEQLYGHHVSKMMLLAAFE